MSVIERREWKGRSRGDLRAEGSRTSLLTSIEEWGASRLRAEWEEVLERFDNRLSLFQSPEWFDHLCAAEPAVQPLLACVRDEGGRLIGIAPLVRTRLDLEYSVKRVRLGKTYLTVLEILGGVPPLPDNPVVYDRLFEMLREIPGGHDGLYMRHAADIQLLLAPLERVVARPILIRPASAGGDQRESCDRTAPDFPGVPISLQIQDASQHPKGRKAAVRTRWRGAEAPAVRGAGRGPGLPGGGGSHGASVVAGRLLGRSGGYDSILAPEAHRPGGAALLRAYVLMAGSQHCAFAVGYQGRETLHHIQTGYEPSLAKYSPGRVLHYRLYEDVTFHNPPRRASFGFGDNAFKRQFGNVRLEEAEVFLINRRLIGKVKIRSYSAFKSIVRIAKKLSRRGSPHGLVG